MKRIFVLCLLFLLLFNSVALATDFPDVQETDWFYDDVTAVAEMGIINGLPDGRFDPTGDLTVAAAIKLAVASRTSYYGEPTVQIDSSEEHWVISYYNYAMEHGMLDGSKTLTEARFDTTITRGEMVTLFAHTLNSSDYTQINDITKDSNSLISGETNASAILLYNAGILIGNDNGFDLGKNITRAETAAIINRVTNPSVRKDTGTLNRRGTSSKVEDSSGSEIVPEAPDEVIEEGEFASYQYEMLDLVNVSRAKEGLGALKLDDELCKAAEQLALEYSQGSNPHKRLDGRSTGTIWLELGLQDRVHIENYGKDYNSCVAYHEGIMNSSGHRSTIMAKEYDTYGIAKVTANGHTYWVELVSGEDLILDADQSINDKETPSTDDYLFSDYQLETLDLVNASRVELGLEPLQLDVDLCKAADQLALEYSQGSSAHKRLDGRLTDTVLDDLGLARAANGRRRAIKENYSKGTIGMRGTAALVHKAWMNSDGHRSEIVSKTHKYIGISKVESNGYIYWVAVYSSN